MTRQSKVKVGWTVVILITALGYSYDTWMKTDSPAGYYAAIAGFLICFSASFITVLKWIKLPADKYVRYTFFSYLPAFFVPCFGMMNYSFSFYGLYTLIWPLMLALFYVFNARSMDWVMGKS